MLSTEQLLRLSEARDRQPETPLVARVIDACIESAKAATVCSDACAPLANAFHLEPCVRQTRLASDLCWASAVALLHGDADRATLRPLLEACRAACEASARVCSAHAPNHEFCRVCGRACLETVDACAKLLAAWEPDEQADQAGATSGGERRR
ncbi:MAG: four-helix bundle copper-binding protein [Myxococcota bacterium]